MAKKTTLKQQADEILKLAEAKGLTQNFFFSTTFERYLTQIEILDKLSAAIKEIGATVTKEYVKGRENICTNPAITEYNKTATAANGTVSTLLNIINKLGSEEKDDELMAFLNADK